MLGIPRPSRGEGPTAGFRPFPTLALAAILACVLAAAPRAQMASGILRATGADHGFCAYLGDNAGAVADSLDAGQHILVHILTPGRAAAEANRARLIAAGKYGLVATECQANWKTLPYASSMVNLLVVEDMDSLAKLGLTRAELDRVLVPGGKLVFLPGHGSAALGKAAAATLAVETKAAPAGSDEWTHHNHGADGNALSTDVNVKPPTHLKWSSGGETIDGKGGPYTGFRIANGRAFYHHNPKYGTGSPELTARDAYNGSLLWRKTDKISDNLRMPMVAMGDRLYYLAEHKNMVAVDGATGNLLTTFSKAPLYPGVEDVKVEALVTSDGKLLQTSGKNKLYAMDAMSGDLKWTYAADTSQYVNFICAAPDAKLAFAVLTKLNDNWRLCRWPFTRSLDAIVGIDLATGKEAWRNTQLAGKAIGPLMYYQGNLGLFCPNAIGGAGWPDSNMIIGVMRASDGHLNWSWDYATYSCGHRCGLNGYTMVMRGDKLICPQGNNVIELDIADGKWRDWNWVGDVVGNNQRCAKGVLTPNYIMTGYITWIDNSWNYALKPIRRSACAMPGYPAYGQTYYSPATCGCIPELDGGNGFVALGDEGSRTVADAWTLTPSGDKNWPHSGTIVQSTTSIRARKAAALAPMGPIVRDWPENRGGALAKATATRDFKSGDYTFTSGQGNLQVDVFRGGAYRFTAVLGGRVEVAPVVAGDLVFIGARDGWLSAYDLNTGALLWSRLAAPDDERILVGSQLESRWPINRLRVDSGKVTVVAGRTAGMGEIFTTTLDPATGAVLSRQREFMADGGPLADPEHRYSMSEERAGDPGPSPGPRALAPATGAPSITVGKTGLTITLPGQAALDITVADLNGRALLQERGSFAGMVRLPYAHIWPGRYVLTVRSPGKVQSVPFRVR